MKMEYSCPNCGDSVEFEDEDIVGKCLSCNRYYQRNTDAEFVDGMWRDKSTLQDITREYNEE